MPVSSDELHEIRTYFSITLSVIIFIIINVFICLALNNVNQLFKGIFKLCMISLIFYLITEIGDALFNMVFWFKPFTIDPVYTYALGISDIIQVRNIYLCVIVNSHKK